MGVVAALALVVGFAGTETAQAQVFGECKPCTGSVNSATVGSNSLGASAAWNITATPGTEVDGDPHTVSADYKVTLFIKHVLIGGKPRDVTLEFATDSIPATTIATTISGSASTNEEELEDLISAEYGEQPVDITGHKQYVFIATYTLSHVDGNPCPPEVGVGVILTLTAKRHVRAAAGLTETRTLIFR